MLRLLRRFTIIAALMFWQGGFTFYAAVVVPIGAEVFGSHRDQGFVTRRVTNWLNLAGAVTLPLLAWDLVASGDPARWRTWMRWAAWFVAAVTLLSLVEQHQRLDALLDPDEVRILEREAFRYNHRIYLWTNTVQWAAALVYLALTLSTWRAVDRVPGEVNEARARSVSDG
jgi:hypothetical protein